MNNNPIIATSILTANFLDLKAELAKITTAGINWIHFDVMDYHFVKNLSFGPKILQDVCNFDSNLNIDCHLMVTIENMSVAEYLKPFILPQVKNITLHYEALTINQLEEFINLETPTFKKGIAINPETPVSEIASILNKIDMVLIMSVNPGAGGQKFINSTLDKIKVLASKKLAIKIAVDGGINDITGKKCLTAGADYLVAGSYLLNSSHSITKQLAKLLTYDK